MSARGVAEHALTVYFEDSEDPAGMARKVLDAYAHELAEEVRQEADRYIPGTVKHRVVRHAADRIDPEVPTDG